MKRVYVTIIKRFFKSGGVDYAMSVNNEEISVFPYRSLAESYLDEKIEIWKDFYGRRVSKENLVSDVIHNDGSYCTILLKDGTRIVFEILSRDLKTR